MRRMSRKVKGIVSCILIICIVFYIEVYSYIVNASGWTPIRPNQVQLPLTPISPGDVIEEPLRVLLVADPQIQGENNEPAFFGLFTRWDSDRYLARNYMLAKYHVQPHFVIFLGDLFDEGSIATDPEYRRYYKRFVNIFQLPRKQDPSPIEYLYIPGDNDVGGEGMEAVDSIKLKWFNQTFGDPQKSLWFTKSDWNIQFLKMNMFLPEEYQNPLKNHEPFLKTSNLPHFRILLSHNSLLQFRTDAVNTIIEKLHPNIVFAAHSHDSSYLLLEDGPDNNLHVNHKFLMPHKKYKSSIWNWLSTSDVESQNRESNALSYSSTIRLNLKKLQDRGKDIVHEINVPTCSYRMGVPDMGFGAFNLYKNGTMDYTVLWLPSRFNQLYAYVAVYVLMKISIIFWVFVKLFYYVINKFRPVSKTSCEKV